MKNLQMISHIGERTSVCVHFDYTPAASGRWDQDLYTPPVREQAEITAVMIVNDNVYDDLHRDTIGRLEDECIMDVNARREEAADRAANERGGR